MIDKKLLNLLGDNKKYIYYTVLVMIVGLISNILVSASICWAIGMVIDFYNGDEVGIKIAYPFLIAFFGVIIRYRCTRISGEYKDILGRNVKKELRNRLYDKILRLGVRSTEDISMAGLTQVSIEGIEQLDLYFSSYIPQFFYAMIAPVVLFMSTVWIDWHVSLILILCVPLIPVSIIGVSKYAKRIFAKYWGKYTSMGDAFLDSVQGLRELKIFRYDGIQHEKMNESSEEFRKITMKVLVMQLFSTTIMDLVAYGGAGLGIAMTVFDMKNSVISPVYGLFLIIVAVEFFLPLRAFGSAFHIAMNGVSAGGKILSILSLPDPVWGDMSVRGTEISLDNVSFSYDGENMVLKDINMRFPDKGMTSIVGSSGCGKSTVVNLIYGGIRPSIGSVEVDGRGLEEYSRESYYSKLALISYDTYIFGDTVRKNFELVKSDVSDEEIYSALRKVNLYSFIMENGGLDKMISEDANNISGGQRQRLALAINLVADKSIYVFDEATSNIDVESEAIIMKNIKDLSREKSVILISHRLFNVVGSDNIYYMENGRVVQKGTHYELMREKGGYFELYNAQKELEMGY